MPRIPQKDLTYAPSVVPQGQVNAQSYSAGGDIVRAYGTELTRLADRFEQLKVTAQTIKIISDLRAELNELEKQAVVTDDLWDYDRKVRETIDRKQRKIKYSLLPPDVKLSILEQYEKDSAIKLASISSILRKRQIDYAKGHLLETLENLKQEYYQTGTDVERKKILSDVKNLLDSYAQVGLFGQEKAKKIYSTFRKEATLGMVRYAMEVDPARVLEEVKSGKYPLEPDERAELIEYGERILRRIETQKKIEQKEKERALEKDLFLKLLNGDLTGDDVEQAVKDGLDPVRADWFLKRLSSTSTVEGSPANKRQKSDLETYFNLKRALPDVIDENQAYEIVMEQYRKGKLSQSDAKGLISYWERMKGQKLKQIKKRYVDDLTAWALANDRAFFLQGITDPDKVVTEKFLSSVADVDDPKKIEEVARSVKREMIESAYPILAGKSIPTYLWQGDTAIPVDTTVSEGKVSAVITPEGVQEGGEFKGQILYIPETGEYIGISFPIAGEDGRRQLTRQIKRYLKQKGIDQTAVDKAVAWLSAVSEQTKKGIVEGIKDFGLWLGKGYFGIMEAVGDFTKDLFGMEARFVNEAELERGYVLPNEVAVGFLSRSFSRLGEMVSKGSHLWAEYFSSLQREHAKQMEAEEVFSKPASVVGYALGSAVPSFGAVITASALAGPSAGASLFASLSSGEVYHEMKGAETSSVKRTLLTTTAFIGDYFLNKMELNILMPFWKEIPPSIKKQGIREAFLWAINHIGVNALAEGVQEALEGMYLDFIAKIGYDPTRNIFSGVLMNAIGGVIGGGAVAGISIPFKLRFEQMKKDFNISDSDADNIGQAIAERVETEPEVIEEAVEKVKTNNPEPEVTVEEEPPTTVGEEIQPPPEGVERTKQTEESTQAKGETQRKQPWEMTKDEYYPKIGEEVVLEKIPKNLESVKDEIQGEKWVVKDINDEGDIWLESVDGQRDIGWVRSEAIGIPYHKEIVEQAIKEGKPVPEEVLKDYPDLVEKYKIEPEQEKEEKTIPIEVSEEDRKQTLESTDKFVFPVGVKDFALLSWMRGMISSGEAGFRKIIWDPNQIEPTIVASKSSYPSFYRTIASEYKISAKQMQNIIRKALVGEPMTKRQGKILDEAMKYAEEDLVDMLDDLWLSDVKRDLYRFGFSQQEVDEAIGVLLKKKYGDNVVKISVEWDDKELAEEMANVVKQEGGIVSISQGKRGWITDIIGPKELAKALGFLSDKSGQLNIEFVVDLSAKARALLESATEDITESWRAFQEIFAPQEVSPDAKETAITIREAMARERANEDRLYQDSVKREKFFWSLPYNARLDFMFKVEEGADFSDENLQAIAEYYRKAFDWAYSLSLQWNADINYVKDYFPHIWEDSKKAQDFLDKTIKRYGIQAFRERFAKHRQVDLIREGLQAGLKLKYTNPEQIFRVRAFSAMRVAMQRQVLEDLVAKGIITRQKAEGLVPIQTPGETYYAPRDVARVIERFLAKSVYARADYLGKVARSALALKNLTTMLKLSLSGFHFTMISLVDIAQHMQVAGYKAMRGDFIGAIKTALSPMAGSLITGSKIDRILKYGPTNEQERIIYDSLMMAGARRIGGEEHLVRIERGIKTALEKKQYYKLPVLVLGNVAEVIQHALFEVYVPRLKLSAFWLAYSDYLEAHPSATFEEKRAFASQLWDSIDNRYGMMVYDNMFWPRWARDIGVLTFLSLGWNLGTIRETGNAFIDLSRMARKIQSGEKVSRADVDRIAFIMAYVPVVATFGAIMTKIMTGRWPEEVKDFFFPPTGQKNDDGTDARVTIPAYTKDFFAMAEAFRKEGLRGPSVILSHKLAPVWSSLAEIIQNRDYYGVQIYNPTDPMPEQVLDAFLFFITNSMTPISVSSINKALEHGKSVGEILLSLAGFSQAPNYITRTKVQLKIYDLLMRKAGVVKTKEEAERRRLRKKVERLLRRGELDAHTLDEAITSGALGNSPEAIRRNMKIIGERAKLPPDVVAFKYLSNEDKVELWLQMKPEDKERYYPALSREAKQMIADRLLQEVRRNGS